ncbi:glycerol kinase [Chloropicon primus]|uniref:glycerol kinase n=1 Tax=Chloropicon primus TaxID=1764295 RepID=A0A5B8MLG5_9CHLO|nr:glycerol kinase [Chloropicon primus]UPR00688.1 glycerol kinase [Chloropicon primus]|eukprot:QDZ21478.1 glycerol kinase [Chloropicon primus]
MLELVGAIDQGTQSTRFVLYDEHARVIASHQIEVKSIVPHPGWAEQDPWELFQSVESCMAICVEEAKKKHGVSNVVVKGIGITNQRETTIAWDSVTGEALHNALVWHDLRTTGVVKRILEENGGNRDAFRKSTGLPLSTYFSAVKIRWLIDNVPAVAKAVEAKTCKFGTVDSWLLYNLTGGAKGGVHVSDITNASRYLLMNLETLQWDEEVAAKFDIDVGTLPAIVSNSELYGKVASGSLEGTPICGCIGDQQAATLGQRCRPGEAKNTYGTGLFLLMNTGKNLVPSKHGLLTTACFQLGKGKEPQYALEGAVATGGVSVSWLRDGINIIDDPKETKALAESVEDTGGVVFVPAFSGLLAPYWREDARGLLIGLTQYTTRAHIARATLEALAFQSRGVLDAMAEDYGEKLTALRVDGGASSNDFLLQFQSDILGIPITRPDNVESTAIGAAFAAGIFLGMFTEEKIFHPDFMQGQKDFSPAMGEDERRAKYDKYLDAVTRSFAWAD